MRARGREEAYTLRYRVTQRSDVGIPFLLEPAAHPNTCTPMRIEAAQPVIYILIWGGKRLCHSAHWSTLVFAEGDLLHIGTREGARADCGP